MEQETETIVVPDRETTVFEVIRVLEGSIHLSEAINRAHILYADNPDAC
jgi:hypothetical protein